MVAQQYYDDEGVMQPLDRQQQFTDEFPRSSSDAFQSDGSDMSADELQSSQTAETNVRCAPTNSVSGRHTTANRDAEWKN